MPIIEFTQNNKRVGVSTERRQESLMEQGAQFVIFASAFHYSEILQVPSGLQVDSSCEIELAVDLEAPKSLICGR